MSETQTQTNSTEPQQARQAPQPPLERAEDLVNQASERVGQLFSLADLRVRQMLARAREEAEDMLAEAQDIRRSSRRHPRKPGNGRDMTPSS